MYEIQIWSNLFGWCAIGNIVEEPEEAIEVFNEYFEIFGDSGRDHLLIDTDTGEIVAEHRVAE